MKQFDLLESVSLEDLNTRSELMERQEQKYAISKNLLAGIVGELRMGFNILEHVGKRVFRYESVYFDDKYSSYWSHHKGMRKRFKIRSRHYIDSNACYLEMKVKSLRDCTSKERIKYPVEDRFTINEDAKNFIGRICKESYGIQFKWKLSPILRIVNSRITMASKRGSERITIDFDLAATNGIGMWRMPKDTVIIETKTPNGFGLSDKILRKHRVHPIQYCSKYCISVAQMGLVSRYNMFKPAIKKIDNVGQDCG